MTIVGSREEIGGTYSIVINWLLVADVAKRTALAGHHAILGSVGVRSGKVGLGGGHRTGIVLIARLTRSASARQGRRRTWTWLRVVIRWVALRWNILVLN